MFNFAIVPVNFYDAKVNQTWEPKAWPAVRRHLNPYADPFIDRINLLIFNYRRQIRLRSALITDLWLHRLGELDELVIQAEAEFFTEQLARLDFIYREYIIENYLDREADSFDPAKLRFDAPEELPIPITYDFPSTLVDIIVNSKDPYEIEPVATRSLARGELPKDESDRYKVPNHVTRQHIEKQMQRSWNHTGPQAWHIAASFNHLLWEFANLKDQDELHGLAGKSRMFLINEAIPLPNKHTWLAWYSLCGLNFQWLNSADIHHARAITRETHDSLLQFTLPSLPMTMEHINGIPNPGDDSGSGHSLSSRSTAHDRNIHGKILHGRWEAYTIVTNTRSDEPLLTPANLLIDDIRHGSTTGRSVLESGLAMWQIALGQVAFYPDAIGIVSDPYFRFMYRSPLHLHRTDRQAFDTGMRSLSEFHNVHLRFSGSEFGALCALEWRETFVREAIRFIRRNDSEILLNEFEAALERQKPRVTQTKVRGRKQQHDFGMNEIFGSES